MQTRNKTWTSRNIKTTADHLFELGISQVVLLLELVPLDRQRTLQLLDLLHGLMDLAQTNVEMMLLLLQVRPLLIVQFHLHSRHRAIL